MLVHDYLLYNRHLICHGNIQGYVSHISLLQTNHYALLQWAGVRGDADPVPPKSWQSGGKQRWMVDSRDIGMWWFGLTPIPVAVSCLVACRVSVVAITTSHN